MTNVSRLSIIVTSGAEKLGHDPTQLRLREGAELSRSMFALGDLVRDLSQNRTPNRVVTSYGGSVLTRMLRDQLGGNCVTKAVCCMKPAIRVKTANLLQLTHEIQHKIPII